LDLDLEAVRERQQDVDGSMGKVCSRGNIVWDASRSRANVVRDIKFRPRWFGLERVDEPTAEFVDRGAAQAVAADLAAVYKAYPDSVELVRLRRAVAPGAYTAEHEAWLQMLATNQGEKLREELVDAGVPASKVSVCVRYAPPDAPSGLFLVDFTSKAAVEEGRDTRDAEKAKLQAILKNGLVAFDEELGRIDLLQGIDWKPRYSSNGKMDEPTAEVNNRTAVNKVFADLFQVWKIFHGVPAIMFADVPSQDDGKDEWYQALGFNRALFCKEALIKLGIPEEYILAGSTGHEPAAFPMVQPENSPSDEKKGAAAVCCSSPRGGGGRSTAAMRIREKLQKATASNRVDDIQVLEDALLQAKAVGLGAQWARYDPVITDAEQQLKLLIQRRRRQEAWTLHKDRNIALSRVKVAYVRRPSFSE